MQYMQDLVFQNVIGGFSGLLKMTFGMLFNTLGWSGIAAIAAGVVLMMSMVNKASKAISSPAVVIPAMVVLAFGVHAWFTGGGGVGGVPGWTSGWGSDWGKGWGSGWGSNWGFGSTSTASAEPVPEAEETGSEAIEEDSEQREEAVALSPEEVLPVIPAMASLVPLPQGPMPVAIPSFHGAEGGSVGQASAPAERSAVSHHAALGSLGVDRSGSAPSGMPPTTASEHSGNSRTLGHNQAGTGNQNTHRRSSHAPGLSPSFLFGGGGSKGGMGSSFTLNGGSHFNQGTNNSHHSSGGSHSGGNQAVHHRPNFSPSALFGGAGGGFGGMHAMGGFNPAMGHMSMGSMPHVTHPGGMGHISGGHR